MQYWCLSRPSATLAYHPQPEVPMRLIGLAVALAVSLVLAPLAAEARGVVQLETFSRAYISGLWEVIGGAV